MSNYPHITLPQKCGWFYILTLSFNGTLGFGITLGLSRRLQKGYCNPTASRQVFSHLYYGKYSQIIGLERYIKNQWGDKRLILFNERLEWFDPVHRITDDALVQFLEGRCQVRYPDIYRVKSDHLPFSPGDHFKDIKERPNHFLERI
jgi:hypothetical protein